MWRKARASTANGQCVEVAGFPHGMVGVRNSRQRDPGHPCVLFTDYAWECFIAEVRAGGYGPGNWPSPPVQVPLDLVLTASCTGGRR